MELSSIERRFLQDLLADRPAARRSQTAFRLCQHFTLGVAVGREVEYSSGDFQRAAQLLIALDMPTKPLGAGASRADAAAFRGQSEKSGTRPPHADSVAVRALGGCELDGRVLSTPFRCYSVLTVQEACRVTADRILIVENLETFRELESYAWLPVAGQRVLAVWRADKLFNPADAKTVVEARNEPVWAFADFDPAGLGISNGCPRLERVLLPAREWLVKAAARGARPRELYADSVAQWQATLDATRNREVQAAWVLMKSLRAGVPQEAMRSAAGDRRPFALTCRALYPDDLRTKGDDRRRDL